ncbi:hypothetical protein ANO14919_096500 [Xylariales sp. No.14919]|nr:hypothetical protein ANO14919_096500 [Xylariales sp. No.14919]
MPKETSRRTPAVICAVVCVLIVFIYIWVSAAAVATAPGANATHYDVLNTTVNASDAELRRAYRRVIRSYHPDKWQRLGARERAQAERRYIQARYSYAVLSGPQRCQYDMLIMNATSKK